MIFLFRTIYLILLLIYNYKNYWESNFFHSGLFKATESKENIHGVRASVTTTVQINILDDNDNGPMFYKCGESVEDCVTATEFTGEILEHSLGSINIGMTVKDLDKVRKQTIHQKRFFFPPISALCNIIDQT